MAGEAEKLNTTAATNDGGSASGMKCMGAKCKTVWERARSLLLNPAGTWEVIRTESTTVGDIYKNYLVILAAVPAIAGFIGLTMVGISMPYPFSGTYHAPFFNTLVSQVITYAISLGMVYVAALVIEKLGPKFGASVNTLGAFKLVAYSMTPAWVAGICGIFPWLMMLAGLLGFGYSVYVFWLGVQPMTGVPADRKGGYVAVSALTIFALGVIIAFVTANFAPTRVGGTYNGQPLLPSQELKNFEDGMKTLQKMLPQPPR